MHKINTFKECNGNSSSSQLRVMIDKKRCQNVGALDKLLFTSLSVFCVYLRIANGGVPARVVTSKTPTLRPRILGGYKLGIHYFNKSL